MSLGHFTGVGVGPGPAGLIPVAALEALKQADLIYLPRARGSEVSVARQCLAGLAIPDEKFREIEFQMDPDRSVLSSHYGELAEAVAEELSAGRHVAYLTIGDSMTYSTYGYLLAALRDKLPGLAHTTFPGVTSFAATASALSWPLGEGKERILILPCPDDMAELRADIASHDIVVLMKIGARLPDVLGLLAEMDIARHCAFARRIGLPGEVLCDDVSQLTADASGYLATMLIRKTAREQRHP
ncbi:precorrin-2 C(20)-methyltransferase [Neisseriaceae bacterium JH1-16]|nr:precorrin-2 C(20)-methyltransferase [Neisseriaceae bacterium JH1-16]